MVKAIRAFLNFCYIARRDTHDTHSLAALDDTLQRFHQHREIFRASGVRIEGFNLPRQHSLIHYLKLIRAYGAPNGLCSSITESKHIKAVKEPWRRSSRFEALSQMLLTNQRLDKLAAARVDFANRGMLEGTCLSSVLDYILRTSYNFMLWYSSELTLHVISTGMNEPEPELEAPHPLYQGPHIIGNNGDGDGAGNIDEDEDDEDDGDVAGPTVEAFVDLAKTARKDCTTLLLNYANCVYSMQGLPG
jgi:hypothetical protein